MTKNNRFSVKVPAGWFLAVCFALALLPDKILPAQDADLEFEQQVVKVTQLASQSLVGLETIGGTGKVDGVKKSLAPGTGIVVDDDGWVLTAAYHLADTPSAIIATLPDGQRVPAKRVATDHSRQLALLKITTDKKLPILPIVARDQLTIGQTLIALGKGFDIKSVQVSTGILSATERIWGKAIQTDAKISPANYGGPLMTFDGRVAGILVPLSTRGDKVMAGTEWYDSGIGFAVPVDEALMRLEQMKLGNDQLAGKLGISFSGADMNADDCEIAFCTGESPAGQAGIRPHDRIVSADGQPTKRQAQLRHVIGKAYAGDEVNFEIDRDGKTIELTAVLAAEVPAYTPVAIGITVDSGDQAQKSTTKDLVIVRQVLPGSSAEVAGILAGDRIISANGSAIESIQDLMTEIAFTSAGNDIKLTIERNDESKQINVPVQLQTAAIPEPSGSESVAAVDKSTTFELKVAEASNTCYVIAPEKPSQQPSLLVWLMPPGELDQEVVKQRWQATCESQNTLLLAIGSADPQRWTPQEISVVSRAIGTLARQQKFNPRRVVIGGRETGGTMASLIGFSQIQSFRGVVLDAATVWPNLPEITTNPITPIMVLVSDAANQPIQQLSLQPIVDSETPVQRMPTLSPDQISRWVNWVDRL